MPLKRFDGMWGVISLSTWKKLMPYKVDGKGPTIIAIWFRGHEVSC
jgi:hypothetical protein